MSLAKTKGWRKSVALAVALLTGISLLMAGCGQSGTSSKTSSKTSSSTSSSSSAKASAADQLAAKRGYILIGYPVPVTGDYAIMGQSAKWIGDTMLAAINKDGGIYIKALGKKLPVKMDMMDTQSSPTMAAQVATEMVTKDHVDMLFAAQTPDIVNPVCGVGEKYHIPVLGLNSPIEPWLSGGPYHWSYDVAMPLADTIGEMNDLFIKLSPKAGKVVGLLFPNDADGVGASKIMDNDAALKKAGIKVVDPGRFPDNTNDFTSLINEFKKDHVEMITGTLPTNTFATFWRQAKEQGYYPEFVDIGKAVDYPAGVTALGTKLANYLCASITWYRDWPFKSSLTGQTCEQFATAYEKATGNESNAALGFYGAGWGIINNTLTRAAELSPDAIRTALSQTDMDTILCHVKFNAQNWSRSPVIQAQWVYEGAGHGKFPWKRVAFFADPHFPNLPTTGKLVFPLPH